jgi:integrase
MPRKSSVWFRSQDGCWYTSIKKRQHFVGEHPAGAPEPKKTDRGWNPPPEIEAAFHRLIADQLSTPEPRERMSPANRMPVARICNEFLEMSQRENADVTYKMHRRFLKPFAAHCAKLKFCDLTPYHFDRWVARHPTWNDGARRGAINVVKACLNWWCDQHNIPSHGLVRLKPPPDTAREVFVSEGDQKRALDRLRSTDPFRYVLITLQETGCRPSEVRRVRPEHFDAERGLWVMPGKSTRRTGKMRVVFLTPAVVAICEQFIADNKDDGPIFRHRNGQPWSRQGIEFRFAKLARELGLPELTPYAMRHSYCTLALMRGVEVSHVATLMGHSGTKIVMKHYQHLRDRIDHMRKVAEQAAGKR